MKNSTFSHDRVSCLFFPAFDFCVSCARLLDGDGGTFKVHFESEGFILTCAVKAAADVSQASQMSRTHIVFVQPLKMLDVTSVFTPFLTHTHTLMLQCVIRSKQRIHTNDKAWAAILGFVICLRDTPTLRVLCRDLEPACSRSDPSTS